MKMAATPGYPALSSLDNVILTAVLEPGELALMGAGLLTIAGLARRRQGRG